MLLGAGGTLLSPRHDVAYFLSLPVSRRRWLALHLAWALGSMGVLVLLVTVVLTLGARRGAHATLLLPLLGRSAIVFVAASAWAAVPLAVVTLVRHSAVAVVLIVGAVAVLPSTRFRLDIPATPAATTLSRCDPWLFADPRAWEGGAGAPVASLASALALGTAGLLIASSVLSRREP